MNVVRRGHHFKSRRASGNPTTLGPKWLRLSLSPRDPPLVWSVMPLNTLFRHLLCAHHPPPVRTRWDRYEGEAGETTGRDPKLSRTESRHQHPGSASLLCNRFTIFIGKPFKIKAWGDRSSPWRSPAGTVESHGCESLEKPREPNPEPHTTLLTTLPVSP